MNKKTLFLVAILFCVILACGIQKVQKGLVETRELRRVCWEGGAFQATDYCCEQFHN